MVNPSASAALASSLQDVLTPTAARSLMSLKGLDEASMAEKLEVSHEELKAWLKDDSPILSSSGMKKIQEYLGVKNGKLTSKEFHFFDIKPGKNSKKSLILLNGMLNGYQINQITGPSEKISSGKMGVYVVSNQIENVWIFIRHERKIFEKNISEKDFPGIYWAKNTKEGSRIPIGSEMSKSIEKNSLEKEAIKEIFRIVERSSGIKVNQKIFLICG